MSDALLEVEDLRVAFAAGGREIRAVDGVSYTIEAGRTLAIIGESGSGKTVGCRAIMGLLPGAAAISGSARLRGTEMIGLSDSELRRHRGQDMAMIFQDPARSLNPTMRVGAQILSAQPEYVLIPSIALLITVAALNTLGDALRERWGVQ